MEHEKILKGGLYWFNFSEDKYSEEFQLGIRPIIILSNTYRNEILNDILVAPLTAQTERKNKNNILLEKKIYINLNSDSVILLNKILTINKNNLGSYITKLNDTDLFRLDYSLQDVLSINNNGSKLVQDCKRAVKIVNRCDGSLISLNNFFKDDSYLNDFNMVKEIEKVILLREKRLNTLEVLSRKTNVNIRYFYTCTNDLIEYINKLKKDIENILEIHKNTNEVV